MPPCELLPTCLFFNDRMVKMPHSAAQIKKVYCDNDYPRCARYMVCKALGREGVPADLFPNESLRAERIIRGKR